MNLRPLHDRIIVHRFEEGEQRIGGIIIPDTAKEKPQQGEVIAAGNGKSRDDGTRASLDVKAGDRILFGKYSGQEIKLDGKEYLIMKEDEVLAVIDTEASNKAASNKAASNKATSNKAAAKPVSLKSPPPKKAAPAPPKTTAQVKTQPKKKKKSR